MADLQLAAWERLRAAYPGVESGLPHDLVAALASINDPRPKWHSPAVRDVDVPADDVADALTIVRMVRRTLDTQEAALIEAGRARGLTWKQLSQAAGLDSPQAIQQRLNRLRKSTGGIGSQTPTK